MGTTLGLELVLVLIDCGARRAWIWRVRSLWRSTVITVPAEPVQLALKHVVLDPMLVFDRARRLLGLCPFAGELVSLPAASRVELLPRRRRGPPR